MKIERTIDRESKLKLYVQIYTIIREKIESGEWPIGTQIPTEDDFCRTYDVSKVTVREAIQELVREGYLKRQQGKGTFVLRPVPQTGLSVRTLLTEVPYGEEVAVRKEIIESRTSEPSDEMKLLLQSEEHVHYILVKKFVNGHPAVLEEIISPAMLILGMDEEDILFKSIMDVIEEKGTKKISKVVQTCELGKVRGEMAYHLGIKTGSRLLALKRIYFALDGSPIAYSHCVLGGKHKVRMEYERIK
jgi:DNA-binding GntR family transcriptional regulator